MLIPRGKVVVMDKGSRSPLDRRGFLALAGGSVVASTLSLGEGCAKKEPPSTSTASVAPPAPEAKPVNADVVRVASVKTAVEGSVLPELVADFEKASSYKVALTPGESVYTWAREGKFDLVISHYGHREAEDFVLDGLGEWPRTIFSNQMALVGPPDDPARVRGLEDAGEAFRRIAASKSKFVLNDIDGVRYLTNILWNAAGQPDRTGWFLDEGHRKDGAIERASEMGAYSFWGLTPFLRLNGQAPLRLEPLVLADPLLQRLLVSVIVKPAKVPGANAEGARALQAHLLSPATQARIRSIRYPGDPRVCWVPAGRHNRIAMLPKG
jgi:tungstate transport system substrate-binding protein